MVSKLDLYKIFCQVGKSESFSRAAKELYMTQPAVSQAIMQLEKELDIRLFTRRPKGVVLTDQGKLLFEHVNSAINLIDAGEKKVLATNNLLMGELKIGVGDTTSRYFLLPYLEKFHSKYPNIKFKIINRTSLELCTMLKSGEIDIAICNLPIEDSSIETVNCIAVQDIFVCGDNFKDLAQCPISFEEVVKYPLILLEPKSNSRQYLEKFMRGKNIQVKPEIELGSHDLLLEFAKINLGIACVVKEFCQKYLENVILYEIKTIEPIPKRNIGYCFLKSVSLSTISRRFLDLLDE